MHIILLLPELKSECDNIIVGLKSGSFDAFEKVYKLYSGKLYNFVMRISGGDSYWAEEIVQRTFVRLWEIHDQVSPDKSLISYLCTIAKNLLMNVYQRQTVEYIYAEYVLESSEEYRRKASLPHSRIHFLPHAYPVSPDQRSSFRSPGVCPASDARSYS